MVYPSQIKVVLIMNALWTWPIKRLYFFPLSSPEIGKLFNDSSLSSTRQTKAPLRANPPLAACFPAIGTKMQAKCNKMPATLEQRGRNWYNTRNKSPQSYSKSETPRKQILAQRLQHGIASKKVLPFIELNQITEWWFVCFSISAFAC